MFSTLYLSINQDKHAITITQSSHAKIKDKNLQRNIYLQRQKVLIITGKNIHFSYNQTYFLSITLFLHHHKLSIKISSDMKFVLNFYLIM